MALYAKTRILQSPKSRTQYITIPSIVVADSQYPFTANEDVELYVDAEKKIIIITKVLEKGKGGEKSG